jgi:HAD superfamily hydrolase (TIGR01509 family)
LLKGILFDMDGVLVDSEEYICRAAIMMFKEHGINVKPEDFLPFVGTGENIYIGGVAKKYNVPIDIDKEKARTYAIYEKISKDNLKSLPGVHDFIKKCRNLKLKLAVATSADKIKMMINLKAIGLGTDTFDALINGQDVYHKKPHPEIYLKASKKLGLKPSECLVIEDAITGIAAGKAAGSKCLALTTTFKKEKFGNADWICSTLENVPEEALMW